MCAYVYMSLYLGWVAVGCWSCLALRVCACATIEAWESLMGFSLLTSEKARWCCIYEASMRFSVTDALPYWSYKRTPEKATSYNSPLARPCVNRAVNGRSLHTRRAARRQTRRPGDVRTPPSKCAQLHAHTNNCALCWCSHSFLSCMLS